MEAALVAADVGVPTCTVHMILHGLARTALSTTSRNVLRAHLRLHEAEFAVALSWCWHVHHRKAPAVLANVSISTSTICVVDFGASSACKYAHFRLFEVDWMVISLTVVGVRGNDRWII